MIKRLNSFIRLCSVMAVPDKPSFVLLAGARMCSLKRRELDADAIFRPPFGARYTLVMKNNDVQAI